MHFSWCKPCITLATHEVSDVWSPCTDRFCKVIIVMGIRKQLFGEQSSSKGVVTQRRRLQWLWQIEYQDKGHDGLPAGISEAGTPSCRPGQNKDAVAGISEAGTSFSRCMFSPLPTLIATEVATPDPEKKYTEWLNFDI